MNISLGMEHQRAIDFLLSANVAFHNGLRQFNTLSATPSKNLEKGVDNVDKPAVQL